MIKLIIGNKGAGKTKMQLSKLSAENMKNFRCSLKCFQSFQKQQMLISFSQLAVTKKICQLKSLITAKKRNY